MDPLDLQDADSWIEQAGERGGLAAEFEAVQGVIAAQTLRYQWLGEGDVSELYPWYLRHLVRIHNIAQGLSREIPYHLDINPDTMDALMMRIRAILATLPEVHNPEDELKYMPAPPKTEDEDL